MEKFNFNSPTALCRKFIEVQVNRGDICIDATMGNGHDTIYLARLVGDSGAVYAFDIQQQALDATKERLDGLFSNVHLVLAGHEEMAKYVPEIYREEIACAVFNFGYLPGGDHQLSTKLETSLKGIETALTWLKKKGMVSLCIYSGGDTGFSEREVILKWLGNLNPKEYVVIISEYYNRPNHPPLPVQIYKV